MLKTSIIMYFVLRFMCSPKMVNFVCSPITSTFSSAQRTSMV